MAFFHHYHLQFIHPSSATVCYYITHLTYQFKSSKRMHNYISGVRFLHKQLGLAPEALDSVPVALLLRATGITIRTLPLRHIPILPDLLLHLCALISSLEPFGPAMLVCRAFSLLAVLLQSDLAPAPQRQFVSSQHTCQGHCCPTWPSHIHQGAKMLQFVGRVPALVIPEVPGHPADPVATYKASPTTWPNQPLLTMIHGNSQTVVMVPML